jgi:aspartokinase-like uncharacterized kinase
MWVVKIGGSLNDDALLPQWLTLLSQLGGGRVALVCGGGRFADEVRRAQQRWQFDDLPAHNMAVLAMAQSAYLALGLQPALCLAGSDAEIRRVLHRGRTALWLPMDALCDRPDAHTNWANSSDSLALALAQRLNAERLIVVKSCPLTEPGDLAAQTAAGVLDARFAQLAEEASFPIELIHKTDLASVRNRLLGLMA